MIIIIINSYISYIYIYILLIIISVDYLSSCKLYIYIYIYILQFFENLLLNKLYMLIILITIFNLIINLII